ncbi:hypothetical protein EYF80_050395 [Liparis tanakae]|uniref:Uncharacterized protein n=1 Tax=Liparis tanakae TaxID=230148 RepID=A0A4Z2FEQ4_9TELE|nr:hypothetical protein EYF80_050395 [Liparis tanakae]
MAGGIQVTSPLCRRRALVLSSTWKSPTALKERRRGRRRTVEGREEEKESTMSGFHILLDGTRMNSTPPKSFGFHRSL